MSQNPNPYFSMDKMSLNALVATGQPDQVNGAQAELDRRRANKAAKRAARLITNYEQAFEEDQERDLIEQERLAQAGSEEEVMAINEPVAN